MKREGGMFCIGAEKCSLLPEGLSSKLRSCKRKQLEHQIAKLLVIGCQGKWTSDEVLGINISALPITHFPSSDIGHYEKRAVHAGLEKERGIC